MREAFGVTSPLSGLRVDLADRELNEDMTDDDRALAVDARLLRRLLRDAVAMGGGWLERADDARERLLVFLGDVASSPSASDLPSSSPAADIASTSALLLLLLVR